MTGLRQKLAAHRILAGFVAGVLASGVAALMVGAYLLFGGFNTAASAAHGKLMAWLVHATMVHSVEQRATAMAAPRTLSPPAILSGAVEYEKHCVACHGGPGVARAPWVEAMLPTPPFLLDAGKRWNHGELYEVIRGGVKMTAMPAWGEVLPRDKLADVVNFVEILPQVPPAQFARLRATAQARIANETLISGEAG